MQLPRHGDPIITHLPPGAQQLRAPCGTAPGALGLGACRCPSLRFQNTVGSHDNVCRSHLRRRRRAAAATVECTHHRGSLTMHRGVPPHLRHPLPEQRLGAHDQRPRVASTAVTATATAACLLRELRKHQPQDLDGFPEPHLVTQHPPVRSTAPATAFPALNLSARTGGTRTGKLQPAELAA
jgi:hypothetical protein